MDKLRIEPVTGALGARVEGIDLARAGPQELAQVQAALNEHLVIYLPDQDLDRFALSRLGRFFGPPFLHPLVDNGFIDCPEVIELLRKPEDVISFGGESWHADVTWMNPPGYVSILHGIEIPLVGGDTGFASTIAAFAALSPAMQDLLSGLRAVHAYHWYLRQEVAEYTVTQPVVRTHPVSGRKGLYVNRMFTSRFEGMTVEESATLLKYLFAHMERHDFTCRFRWRAGGVLIWDNRFTLHYPMNDLTGQRRRMIRTTSLEAGPA
jgi:taurine dioxygenase